MCVLTLTRVINCYFVVFFVTFMWHVTTFSTTLATTSIEGLRVKWTNLWRNKVAPVSKSFNLYVRSEIYFLSLSLRESTKRRLRDGIQVESIFLLYSHCFQPHGSAWPSQRQQWQKIKQLIKSLMCKTGDILQYWNLDSPSVLRVKLRCSGAHLNSCTIGENF